jgi:hypothetical protein
MRKSPSGHHGPARSSGSINSVRCKGPCFCSTSPSRVSAYLNRLNFWEGTIICILKHLIEPKLRVFPPLSRNPTGSDLLMKIVELDITS